MNIRTFFRNLFSYKLFVFIALGYLIPQAVFLAMRLAWLFTIIIVMFLTCELLIVLIVRVWFPHRVNVTRVSSGLFNVVCQVLYSCFDLLFGRVLQSGQRRNTQYKKQIELRRMDSPGRTLQEQKALSNKYGFGYTPMARIAMTNSANKPNKPARFSL